MEQPDSEFIVRHFTEADWHGYSGATPFPDGTDPVIGLDDRLIAIADSEGLYVELYDADADCTTAGWLACSGWPVGIAKLAVVGAMTERATLTLHRLMALGFHAV